MADRLSERVGDPLTEQHKLWIDWSGISAVWVCICGTQDFGGLSLAEARSQAMRHRASKHPDWPAIYTVHVEGPPCRWGDTVWGAELGETCNDAPRNNGFCNKHHARNRGYEKYGVCEVEGCWTHAYEGQLICKTHLNRWVKQHRLDMSKVAKGEILWPELPVERKGGRPKSTFNGERPVVYVKQHGTRQGYKRGCRCGPCSIAQSAYAAARYKARKEGAS